MTKRKKKANKRNKNRTEVARVDNQPPSRKAGVSIQTSEIRAASFSGPLPPPALLREYDEIISGGAERILKMAETQSLHRQALESHMAKAESNQAYLGVASGVTVSLATIVVGGFLVFNGHDWAGGTMVTGTVVSLVTAFIYGTRSRRAERNEIANLTQLQDG